MSTLRVVVLISGRGSNLQALLESGSSNFTVVAAISNKASAAGLNIAREHGVATTCVDHRAYPDRVAFDRALAEAVTGFQPDVVVLAGFMRILTAEFVDRFLGRLINLHPSLLPKYPGVDTHERVIGAGDRWHGASVHFVTAELDAGPVIAQVRLEIQSRESATHLAARLLPLEHRLIVAAVELLSLHSVQMTKSGVRLNGTQLSEPLSLEDITNFGAADNALPLANP